MKTRLLTAMRCKSCGRNLPADAFRLTKSPEGWSWRCQPCKRCVELDRRVRLGRRLVGRSASMPSPRRGTQKAAVRGWRLLPEAECTACRITKPISEYYGGTARICKECAKAASRARRAKLPPEQREESRKKLAAWKSSHPAEIHIKNQMAKRQRRLAGARIPADLRMSSKSGRLTTPEWNSILDAFNGKCAYCDTSGKMEIEHIVPVAHGGTHTKDNIVPACRKCNLDKNAKELRSWLQDEDRYQFVCDMRS